MRAARAGCDGLAALSNGAGHTAAGASDATTCPNPARARNLGLDIEKVINSAAACTAKYCKECNAVKHLLNTTSIQQLGKNVGFRGRRSALDSASCVS